MSETIIPAKPDQRIWILSNEAGPNAFHTVDVIAWSVNGIDTPVPITPFGRYVAEGGYVLGTETNWIALPNGPIFRSSNEVLAHLRSHQQ